MAERSIADDLYDPRTGGRPVRTHDLRFDGGPGEPARTNYFSIYRIDSGGGRAVWADVARFAFGPGSLLFFVPYQHVRFAPAAPVRGDVVQFHANFLCVETFHAEAGCSGVLFDDPYGGPAVVPDDQGRADAKHLVQLALAPYRTTASMARAFVDTTLFGMSGWMLINLALYVFDVLHFPRLHVSLPGSLKPAGVP